MCCDADGLLVQERQHFHPPGLGDFAVVHRKIGPATGRRVQSRGVTANHPDPPCTEALRGCQPVGVVLHSDAEVQARQQRLYGAGKFDAGGDFRRGPGQDSCRQHAHQLHHGLTFGQTD